MRLNGLETSLLPVCCPQATWTTATSATSQQAMWPDTLNAISSRASEDGDLLPGMPVGRPISRSGQDRLPASRGVLPGLEMGSTTNATFGPRCSALSRASDRLSSWESKLKERLAEAGSTRWPSTWRNALTPSGLSFSRLLPLGRHTAGTGYTLWPTPAARDYKAPNKPSGASRLARPPKSGRQLPNEIVAHLGGTTDSSAGTTGSLGWLSQEFVCWLMGYPTEWIALAPLAMP
jgi:hypothetical protein